MRVYINGESREVAEYLRLSELIILLELPSLRIAVELNRKVMRRTEWEDTELANDDRIEVVHFVGGGSH